MKSVRLPRLAYIAVIFCVATAVTPQAQTLTTLVSFVGFNGGEPANTNLIQGTDGNLCGATQGDGVPNTKGTIFKITPEGKLTTLYSFCSETNCAEGGEPSTGLVIGPNGGLYGTTFVGGASSLGTLFEFTAAGQFTVLHNFNPGEQGLITLMLAGDGSIYGTTSSGYNIGGKIFRLAPGGDFTTIYSFCSRLGAPTAPILKSHWSRAPTETFMGLRA